MYGIFTYTIYYWNHPNVGKYAMNPMGLFPPLLVVEFHPDSLCCSPVPPKERMRHRKKRHDAPSTPRRENSAWRFGRIGRKWGVKEGFLLIFYIFCFCGGKRYEHFFILIGSKWRQPRVFRDDRRCFLKIFCSLKVFTTYSLYSLNNFYPSESLLLPWCPVSSNTMST